MGGTPKFNLFSFFFSFTAAEGGGFSNGHRGRHKSGAGGVAPLEGEGNPAEGGYFASKIYCKIERNI